MGRMGVTDAKSVSTLSSSAALPRRADDLVGVMGNCISRGTAGCASADSTMVNGASQGSMAAKNDSFLAFWPLEREGVGVLR